MDNILKLLTYGNELFFLIIRAFGVTIWEIFSDGQEPYKGVSDLRLYLVEEARRLAKPQECSDELYTLMLKCWNADPHQRFCFAES